MKRLTRLQKNLLFAAVLLLAAVVLFWALRGRKQGEALVAVADFGDGITETIPLDKDYDYLYDVGDYVVHLQVKDGAIAFQDSQCPDHVCEQFGWLSQKDAWAACVPAGGREFSQQKTGGRPSRSTEAASRPFIRFYCALA